MREREREREIIMNCITVFSIFWFVGYKRISKYKSVHEFVWRTPLSQNSQINFILHYIIGLKYIITNLIQI